MCVCVSVDCRGHAVYHAHLDDSATHNLPHTSGGGWHLRDGSVKLGARQEGGLGHAGGHVCHWVRNSQPIAASQCTRGLACTWQAWLPHRRSPPPSLLPMLSCVLDCVCCSCPGTHTSALACARSSTGSNRGMPIQREGVVLGDLHIVASQPRRHSPLPAFWRDSGGGRRRAVLLRAPSLVGGLRGSVWLDRWCPLRDHSRPVVTHYDRYTTHFARRFSKLLASCLAQCNL